jgi:hypothetical protein
VPHDQEVWLPGRQKTPGSDVYETDVGELKVTTTLSFAAAPAMPTTLVPKGTHLVEITDESVLTGVNDCCGLDQISEASILHTTRVRKKRGDIYTNISTVLLSVNPYKPLAIYSSEYLELYRTAKNIAALPPHVFGVGATAFEGIHEMHESQAMLISGESGAGKTETMKLLLLYASEVLSGQDGSLEDMVLEINPILEAFGNAKTLRMTIQVGSGSGSRSWSTLRSGVFVVPASPIIFWRSPECVAKVQGRETTTYFISSSPMKPPETC